jgi:DNA-binding winged helix-turn-helix (wHTH) protein
MKKNSNNISNGNNITLYCVGPLNIDRQTKLATTSMGAELLLSPDEFEALDILAAREGEPLTFEQLYRLVWGGTDSSCNIELARFRLNNLMVQVREAGEGFMWIEYVPERGYTFRTRWGHNWPKGTQSAYDNQMKFSKDKIDDLMKRIKTLTPKFHQLKATAWGASGELYC